LLDESFALSRELGDKESIANCLSLSGMLALDEGDTARAASLVEQALALFKEIRQQHGMALSLYALARVATVQGIHTDSQALYEQGLATNGGSPLAWKGWQPRFPLWETMPGQPTSGVLPKLCVRPPPLSNVQVHPSVSTARVSPRSGLGPLKKKSSASLKYVQPKGIVVRHSRKPVSGKLEACAPLPSRLI
jgi:hypothetical protein